MINQEELKTEVFELEEQKAKLESEIASLEDKLAVIHSGKVNGKITLPCQTQMQIEPEWHLKTSPEWSIGAIKIFAILSMNQTGNARPQRFSNEIDTGRRRFMLDQDQHVIELYDKQMFNRMTFD